MNRFKDIYNKLTTTQISQIIKMALSDDVAFKDIEKKFQLKHGDVIKVMRKNISARAFKNWRKRSTSSLRNKKKHQDLM